MQLMRITKKSGKEDLEKNEKVLRCIHLLLDKGANPKLVRDDGATPLHFAARRRILKAVKWLVRSGADPGAPDRDSQTPLHNLMDVPEESRLSLGFAVDEEDENLVSAARFLVGHQPDELLYARDDNRLTPFSLAIIWRRFRSARLMLHRAGNKRMLVETGDAHLYHLLGLDDFPDDLLQRMLPLAPRPAQGRSLILALEAKTEPHRKAAAALLPLMRTREFSIDTEEVGSRYPLGYLVHNRRWEEARAVLDSHLGEDTSETVRSVRDCCKIGAWQSRRVARLVCPGHGCTFLRHLQVNSAFMGASQLSTENVRLMTRMVEKGFPLSTEDAGTAVPVTMFLRTGHLFEEEGAATQVLELLIREGAVARECDSVHVMVYAPVDLLARCIRTSLVLPERLVSACGGGGLPSRLRAEPTLPKLYLLSLCLPERRGDLLRCWESIRRSTYRVVAKLRDPEEAKRFALEDTEVVYRH